MKTEHEVCAARRASGTPWLSEGGRVIARSVEERRIDQGVLQAMTGSVHVDLFEGGHRRSGSTAY